MQVVLTLDAGGTERLVVEICRLLQSRFAMSVCTLDQPGAWAGALQQGGVDVVPLLRRPGFQPTLGYRIARLAQAKGASIIHCHHYSPFVYGRIATLLNPGLRLVFTEHGRLSDGPPSSKRQLVNPVLGRLPGSLIAVSHALRQSMIEEGFPSGRLEVVHNGIHAGAPPSAAARRHARATLGFADGPDGPLVVGAIARLNPVKDLGTLIEAFAAVRATRPDAALVIVGDGEERSRLEEIARALGLLGQVHLLGHRDDARDLLPAFDIYANSSTSEGISLTILEAMAAGLPVVATRVGGTPEVVDDRVHGLLVPSRSPGALAGALGALAADPVWCRALGAAGRLAVSERFTIDRMVEHYAQLYLRLAS